MTDTGDGRGTLYPASLPSFHRESAPEALRELVRWFWIPRWELPVGQMSRQHLLPFPASNLVIESGTVKLFGPTTRASHRDLAGRGWALGALLRPAGVSALHPNPSAIRDTEVPVEARELLDAVVHAMHEDDAAGRVRATEAVGAWLTRRPASPGRAALLANRMEDLIASDRNIVRVEQAAERLHVSVRALQRLADRYVGLPPLAIIRRYRLQEAAERLRNEATLTIAEIAAELGYTDHAHLTNDFSRVLGVTPNVYRRRSGLAG